MYKIFTKVFSTRMCTFSDVTTVSWCFLTASWENSDVARRHMLSNAKYLHNKTDMTYEYQNITSARLTTGLFVNTREKKVATDLRLVSRCCRNWPSWLQALTSKFGSESVWMMRFMASNNTAFLAFECWTFFDFGGSCALFSMVSKHSDRRFFTATSSVQRNIHIDTRKRTHGQSDPILKPCAFFVHNNCQLQ